MSVEKIFDEPFFSELTLPDDIREEVEADGPVVISVMSSTNDKGDVQRVRQAVRSTKSGRVHLAELHKIGNESVMYTKDVDAKKTARYGTMTVNIPDGKLKDFEQRFEKETKTFHDEEAPELLSKTRGDKKKPAAKPKAAASPKSTGKSSPRKEDSPRSSASKSASPAKATPKPKMDPATWKKDGDAYAAPDDYIDGVIAEINKFRASKDLTQLVRNEDVMKVAVQFAKKMHFPKAYADLEFSKVDIPNSFGARMASWSLTTDKGDPTDDYIRSLAEGNGEEAELAPFTDIGLGILRVGKKYVFCRVYACLHPSRNEDIYEITEEEEGQLMHLINSFRKQEGMPPLNHSREITDRAYEYKKLTFSGVDPNSEQAKKVNAKIKHDRSYKQFSGGMSTTSKNPITEIFNALKKSRKGDLLDSYDDIGTTIVHDQFNHWSWLICFEKD